MTPMNSSSLQRGFRIAGNGDYAAAIMINVALALAPGQSARPPHSFGLRARDPLAIRAPV